MANVTFKIEKSFGAFSDATDNDSYKKELNLVSWNNRDAKFDVRGWNADHTSCGKGITLTKEEISSLKKLLNSIEGI